MKRTYIPLIILVILALGVSVVRIVLSAAFSTLGTEYNSLVTKKLELQKENMILSEKVYTKSAYTTIAQQAQAQGYVAQPRNTQLVLTETAPFALNR